MQLVRTILVIVVFYYLIRFLSRVFGPMLIRYAAKKAQEKYQGPYRGNTAYNNGQQRREGEVVIDKASGNTKENRTSSPGKKVGEYIDFEEVD
ncbi:DUF4834 family protein [Sinomicrobium soli]|uniref:DUF4834 family protein n=1 Tax=Sinomicrobium sp. N-1-3-6 TaxID=2219864 RepID=UPI000DCC6BFF|nr:DUF4834 family protein [Sinomicrobium sp. N-1-3-6]RAV27829.1 DUF4834 domain-containing protein [Sinomicrobium sp. N-1-3-6]